MYIERQKNKIKYKKHIYTHTHIDKIFVLYIRIRITYNTFRVYEVSNVQKQLCVRVYKYICACVKMFFNLNVHANQLPSHLRFQSLP